MESLPLGTGSSSHADNFDAPSAASREALRDELANGSASPVRTERAAAIPIASETRTMIANTRILVADDDPAVLQTVAWVLKEQGYDVSAAADGRSLFERLERDAPDLLLLDVAMPGSDNYQTLERIKADDRWRDLPVLMVSSLPPDEAAVRTLGLGAADFVRKPVRVRELLARIQAQLRVRADACGGARRAATPRTWSFSAPARKPRAAGSSWTSCTKSPATCPRMRSIISWRAVSRERSRSRIAR